MLETVLINFNDKRATSKMNIIIFCTLFLLVIILLLKIATICYNCIKHWSKREDTLPYKYYKMAKNNELKEIDIKNCKSFYFDNNININDFNPKNINVDKKII